MHGRTYKTRGKDSIMEKDPEIVVIAALCAILELSEWKSLSSDGKKRCLEYFTARRSDEDAFKGLKPAPEKHRFIEEAAKKYIDWTKELPKTPIYGPGKDDYGRKPRPLDITCQGGRANIPKSALTMTSSTSFSNSPIGLPPSTLGLSYLEDC